ncbi:HAD-IA family hydrolase [Kluyvera sichuanensis]|uniref:HAD-IA family hydrolase n=1 Tax=Kluyvera sichuanensis TaxID=2725494 RepID=UPI0039F6A54B
MTKFECNAVLFDLDGTLVDSGPCIERLWELWAKKNHVDVKYVLSIIHGRTVSETLKLISPYFYNQKCIDEIKFTAMEALSHVSPIPGAVNLFRQLPMNKVAIVTSGIKAVSMRSIIGAGIPVPDVMITADDVSCGKPDPEPYLKAASRLGVNPNNCLVFEDAYSGIRSAIAAGMSVIVVGKTGQSIVDGNATYLDDFRNVIVVVKDEIITFFIPH